MEAPVAIAAGRGSDAASTDRSARLGRLARSAPSGGEKQKEILLFATFFRSDPGDARDDGGKRERFSLSWFAADQTLGFQREVRYRRMATRNAAKGARCSIRRRRRADAPRTFRRFRSACDSVARASFRAFSVCSGYPASFFGPWLCACVWHESMLLSCVWRASRDRRVG